MKGKGSRLAILLATVLTLVGAFGVTSFAAEGDLYKVVFSANDKTKTEFLTNGDSVALADTLKAVGYDGENDKVDYVYDYPNCISTSGGKIAPVSDGSGLLRVARPRAEGETSATTMDVDVSVTKHTHEWNAGVDGSKALLYCNDEECPYAYKNQKVIVELTADESATFEKGTRQTANAQVTKTPEEGFPADIEVGEIRYYRPSKDKERSDGFIEADNYEIRVDVTAGGSTRTLKKDFEIKKASYEFDVNITGWEAGEYDESKNSPTVSPKDPDNYPVNPQPEYTYYDGEGNEVNLEDIKNAEGTYVVKATIPATKNYEEATSEAEFSVTVNHEHTWAWERQGSHAVKIYCTDEDEKTCEYTEGFVVSLAVEGEQDGKIEYDGKEHRATVDDASIPEEVADDFTIAWKTEPEEYTKITNSKFAKAYEEGGAKDAAKYTAYGRVWADFANGKTNVALTKEFEITPKNIEVFAENKTINYGDPAPEYTVKVKETTPLAEGDQVEDAVTGKPECTYEQNDDVGKYTIDPASVTETKNAFGKTNYHIVEPKVSGILTVNQADNEASVTVEDWYYGDDASEPAVEKKFGLEDGSDETVEYRVKGEDSWVEWTEESAPKDANDYEARVTVEGTKNYNEVTSEVAGFTVHKAEISVEPDKKTSVYGSELEELTYTVTPAEGKGKYVEGDDLGIVLTTTAQKTSNVGTYDITVSTTADKPQKNYDVTFVQGAGYYTITPATLTVTGPDLTKVYGEADPEFTYTVDGLVNGDTKEDTLEGELTRNTTSKTAEYVGDHPIKKGTLAVKEKDGVKNYELTYVPGNINITPAELKITAAAVTKVYGEADPELTYSVEGFKYEDSEATDLTGALSREEGEDVGEYAISQGTLDVVEKKLNDSKVKNYTISFKPAVFTITPATLKITADPQSKVYGSDDPELTYKYEGLAGDDTADVITGKLERAEGENVGKYEIKQGTVAASDNYTIEYTGADLEIIPAVLTITANAGQTKTYGEADPKLMFAYNGLTNGDKADVITGALTRDKGEDVGEYKITIGTLAAPNYDIEFTGNFFQITKAELTVKANDKTISYGEVPSTNGATFTGLAKGDKIDGVKLSTDYVQNGKPGTYNINVSVPQQKNYKVKVEAGKLTVNDKVSVLVAKARTIFSKRAKLSWNEVTGAASYDIYFNKCNSNGVERKCKKIATVKGSKKSFTKKGLKKGQCYKFYVVAKDANGKVISKSKCGHFVAGKYNKNATNARSISVNNSSVSIAKGGTFKIKATQKKAKSGRPLLNGGHSALVRYTSSNNGVAVVSKSGVITGVGSGYCRVYTQAVDGVWDVMEVNVQ